VKSQYCDKWITVFVLVIKQLLGIESHHDT